MPDMEYKFIKDVKAIETVQDGKLRFSGYLAYFDNVDSYGDVIERGAFAKTIREAKRDGRTVPVLEQHGGGIFGGGHDMTPIGYYENLKEDNSGLWAEGVLFTTSRGQNMHTILKESPKGAMGQSIGYRVIQSRMADEADNKKGIWRYLQELYLGEGSIVTFPANNKARVEDVKSAALFWRELECTLRKNGFSKENSKKIISLVKKHIPSPFTAERDKSNTECVQQNLSVESSAIQTGNEASALLDALKEVKIDNDIKSLKRALANFSLH